MSVSDPLLRDLKGNGTILMRTLAYYFIARYCKHRILLNKII